MFLRTLACTSVLSCAALCVPLQAQQTSAAITNDPAADKANPASMEAVQVPSHGVLLNGLVYVAAGAGPHPVVVLLHGFPGNEKNLDLAQTIRRAGWDVLYFDYRGSWGTPGAFSFAHAMEDTQAAVAYLRDPVVAKKLRAEPKQIVLVGHSMGGLLAAWEGAQDSQIEAVGLISAADMSGNAGAILKKSGSEAGAEKTLAADLAAEGLAPLAGCTPESLAKELLEHAQVWSLPGFAAKLASRPVLIVTSDDGLAASNDALAEGLDKAGDVEVREVHLATDHAYSDKRIELQETVLEGLRHLREE